MIKFIVASRKVAIVILPPLTVGFIGYMANFHFDEFSSNSKVILSVFLLLLLSFVTGCFLWFEVFRKKIGVFFSFLTYLLACVLAFSVLSYFKV